MNVLIDIFIWVAYLISLYFSVFLVLVYWDKRSFFTLESSPTHLDHYPLISIFVPAYNEEKTILGTLQSIEGLDYPKNKLEVIVINDGSKDNTVKIISAYIQDKPHFRLLSHKNMGKAASLNKALAQAKGEFFACLDADSFVEKLTLRKMLHLYYQEKDPRLAIVTPAMKVAHPENFLQKIQWLEYIVLIFISRLASQMDSLYVAPGPFSLYRTDIIRKLKGFDPSSITEDQEIAYRIQKYHYRIKQCFDGYVYTTAPKTLKPFYRQRRRWYLGSIDCLHRYKELVANRKYGDFGLMQMVKSVLGYILSIAGVILSIYLFIIPLGKWLQKFFVINFGIITYIQSLTFHIQKLDFLLADFKKIFLLIFLFLTSLFFFYQAHRNAREKINRFGWIPIIPYFLFYYLLKGLILLASLAEFSRRKKLHW